MLLAAGSKLGKISVGKLQAMNWFTVLQEIGRSKQIFPLLSHLHSFSRISRDLDEFSKLLLGTEMSTAVDEVVRRRDRRRLEAMEIEYELGHCQLMNTRLKDVLKTAKRAFSISDSSGSLFRNLTEEITSQHSILHSLVDGVLKDKEPCSSDERELGIFPRASILPALFAQGLFPGLFERSLVDDYF